MDIYIRSASSISPQHSFRRSSLQEWVAPSGNALRCIEPDYKEFIDAKLIRRMSRIIRMGVATALQCLREAEVDNPGAIITGTAYGCLEDTGLFLAKMIGQQEELLSPTAFIQSTHNTVAAQIALLLHCHHYNNTFVHRGLSFENALLDAIGLLREDEAANVLVGGIDEITDTSHAILSRFGLYKQGAVNNQDLSRSVSKGTIAGEGAAFMLLSKQPGPGDFARLVAVKTFYKPSGAGQVEDEIREFLATAPLKQKAIDLVITGENGDEKNDQIYGQLANTVFDQIEHFRFKPFCGEYPTATSFALWLATTLLKEKKWPASLNIPKEGSLRNILIYNHYQQIHHSLILVEAC